MDASIIVSVVSGICSIIGVVIASAASSGKLQKQLEISQAVMDTKLKNPPAVIVGGFF